MGIQRLWKVLEFFIYFIYIYIIKLGLKDKKGILFKYNGIFSTRKMCNNFTIQLYSLIHCLKSFLKLKSIFKFSANT